MSVATDLVPDCFIPEQARTHQAEPRLASVTTLHRPSDYTGAVPLRLTRRGVLVLAVLVTLVAMALLGVAALSAPSSAGGSAATTVPRMVTVQAGDSLWTIATRVAPQRDPRAEVANLQRINHLEDTGLVPGQILRTR